MNYEMRPITANQVFQFRTAVSLGFGHDANPKDDDRFLSLMPLDRTVAVFDGDEVVGTLGDFDLQLTVPGGVQVAMAGTTMVGVRATHTRQGILRSMVTRHLDNAVARGESVAGLWASEPGIYGRFGFGLASEKHFVTIDTRQLSMEAPSESIDVSMIAAADLPGTVAPFWSGIATQRSGFIDRGLARWEDIIVDPEHRREGGTAARHIVARRGDIVVGYLEYRQAGKWIEFVSQGAVSITSLVAEDIEAHRALWYYVTDIDLFPNVDFWNAATDDQLAYEVANARSIRRTVGDALYVRILDVPAALSARRYESDGDIVLQVTDDMGYAAGRFRLHVVDGFGTVTETTNDADVTLAARELGALYLGRVCCGGYVRSGLITGNTRSVRQLGQMFVTDRAPWCSEEF